VTDHANDRPVALVTGAGAGIGAAAAAAAAQGGYDLVLVDLSSDALSTVAEQCRDHGAGVVEHRGDVTDLDAMKIAAAQANSLHAVLHCAGIEVLGAVHDTTPSDWQRCLKVNAYGTFAVAAATIDALLASKGSFTAVASDAGITGAQGFAAYCASKHAVVGLIKCMALDYGPRGVRSNAVAPGFVQTAMTDRIFADDPTARDFYTRTVPLGRFATPEEVAAAMLHLAGPHAAYTNGMIYRIDGGSTAGYFTAPTT
jgi:NAD(P)-dependent dehydrogenase (short-subunit alcohol dehydrogenase family)